jgi:hypothetical protein
MASVAKPLVSLGERILWLLLVFPPRREAKRNGAKSTADSGLARPRLRESATRKWRRKPLESPKTDSEMAPPLPVAGRENRSGELRMT